MLNSSEISHHLHNARAPITPTQSTFFQESSFKSYHHLRNSPSRQELLTPRFNGIRVSVRRSILSSLRVPEDPGIANKRTIEPGGDSRFTERSERRQSARRQGKLTNDFTPGCTPIGRSFFRGSFLCRVEKRRG